MSQSETAVRHSPGPWHTCCDGKCSCFTVMADEHPIAQITHGDWGDEYPELRLVGDGIGRNAEAYMEKIVYGSIGEAMARANWHLIAAAPDLLDALKGLLDFVEIDNLPMDKLALQIARQAIAKAEGKQP